MTPGGRARPCAPAHATMAAGFPWCKTFDTWRKADSSIAAPTQAALRGAVPLVGGSFADPAGPSTGVPPTPTSVRWISTSTSASRLLPLVECRCAGLHRGSSLLALHRAAAHRFVRSTQVRNPSGRDEKVGGVPMERRCARAQTGSGRRKPKLATRMGAAVPPERLRARQRQMTNLALCTCNREACDDVGLGSLRT